MVAGVQQRQGVALRILLADAERIRQREPVPVGRSVVQHHASGSVAEQVGPSRQRGRITARRLSAPGSAAVRERDGLAQYLRVVAGAGGTGAAPASVLD